MLQLVKHRQIVLKMPRQITDFPRKLPKVTKMGHGRPGLVPVFGRRLLVSHKIPFRTASSSGWTVSPPAVPTQRARSCRSPRTSVLLWKRLTRSATTQTGKRPSRKNTAAQTFPTTSVMKTRCTTAPTSTQTSPRLFRSMPRKTWLWSG
jgi:hypothetical protein